MSYIQELTDSVKEINEDMYINNTGIKFFLLGNISKELAIIADEMHEMNMARKAKAMYDLGIISREEMLKIFVHDEDSGGEKK